MQTTKIKYEKMKKQLKTRCVNVYNEMKYVMSYI